MSQDPDEQNPEITDEVREAERRLARFAGRSDDDALTDDALTDDDARVSDDALTEREAD
ncbi:hypothetical protein M8C17_27755 [Micromonospora sp. RHAY321]|uniref:hypothetical protein n=1 Tax=Micromonospora sp. RHAY321 TaxID=2944807 RepID=UPI00207C5353|nr:hypothetical protein [Micromonospora sp. RHAY321]MCO1598954.1 hypothetical protein [Micromonospora sp. RHAY321]